MVLKLIFWQILWRSIRMRPAKWALMVSALGIGVSVAVAISSMTLDLESKMNRELRAYGPNLLIRPAGREGRTLPEGILDQVKTRAGRNLHAAAPFLYRLGQANQQKVVLVGSELESLATLYPSWRFQSRPDGFKQDDCLVGKKLAGQLSIESGEGIEISFQDQKRTLRAADILITGEIEEGQLFVPLKFLQELTGERVAVSVVALSLLGRFEEVARFAHHLEGLLPGTEVKLIRRVAVAEGEVLGKLKLMMLLSAVILLIITGLSIATTISSIILERREEIALFKAIGLLDTWITRLFLMESLFLGIASGLLGYFIGFGMSQVLGKVLFDSLIIPPWPVFPAALLFSIATSLIAFAAPVRRTLAIDPAIVLRGE